jgi:uracil-DNA glycosylase
LCAEGFSGLINAAEERGSIQGVTICAGAPSITHFLFADDLLLLLKANEENTTHLRQVLQIYETCSGRKLTRTSHPSSLARTQNPRIKRKFMQIMELTQESLNARYLGLPRQAYLHI